MSGIVDTLPGFASVGIGMMNATSLGRSSVPPRHSQYP